MTSECPECPPYVIRCAHWEGVKVELISTERMKDCGYCGVAGTHTFAVAVFKAHWVARWCRHCGDEMVKEHEVSETWYHDEPSALTEFQTRAAHLLERA